MTLSSIFAFFSVAFYIVAGALFVREFFKACSKRIKYANALLMLAAFLHLVMLVIAVTNHENEQLSLTFVAALLTFVVTVTMFLANKYTKNLIFMPVVCFASATFVLLHIMFSSTTGIRLDMNISLASHIVLSVLAFGVLGISALYACQLAFINYQLKRKSSMVLHSGLPPLMSVERILYRLMSVGSVLLFVALTTGYIFIPSMFTDGYAHKTLLSSLALLTYIVALILHKVRGLRARSAVVFNIIGISLLGLGYFGSRIVREILIS